MGQYYLAIILGEKTDNKEIIRLFLDAHCYDNGAKLGEHSYVGNNFVSAIEHLLSPKGMFYKSRLVWAGDYADNEQDQPRNLYDMARMEEHKARVEPSYDMSSYPFIVNHTKKLYVNKKKNIYHPLSLLTAEGNGRGGGDYNETNADLCGTWSRDLISVEETIPTDYEELVCNFNPV